MATLLLGRGGAWAGAAIGSYFGPIGTLIGGVVGGIVGGAAGAYVDQAYVYPLFSTQKDLQGPRLDDLPVQTGSEGSGMHYCLGNQNRIAGTVIWLSDLIEVKRETDVEGGKGGGGGQKQKSYDYYLHVAIGVCDCALQGPIEGIDKIWADSKLIYDSDADPPNDHRAHLIRVYRGFGSSQTADPLIQSYEGAANTPAFRDTCYVVIEGLHLMDFGNRLPQFTFLVRRQDHESVAAAIYNTMNRGGFADEDFNVDQVERSVRGYTTTGLGSTLQALEPLLAYADVLTQEKNGVLHFFTRGREETVEVDVNDMTASEGTDPGQNRPFQLTDPSGFELPRQVHVQFIDPTLDWQRGDVLYTRNEVTGQQVLSIDLPIVMHPSTAGNIAANQLWRRYAERMKVEFVLPPTYLHLQENDLATWTYEDVTYTARLAEVNIGNNFMVECSGLLVGAEPADEHVACGERRAGSEPVAHAVTILSRVLDVPAVRDADQASPGIYFAAAGDSNQGPFRGAAVYMSPDGVNYALAGEVEASATMGKLTQINGGTGTGAGDPAFVDDENTFDVLLFAGELESVSDAQLFNGANRMWVGAELLAFGTATPLGHRTYRLSHLLRGLRGTYTAHSTDEACTKASPDTVGFLPLNAGLAGTPRYFKFVQAGQALEDVEEAGITYMANNVRQLPVCHLRSTGVALSTDLSLTWVRRTRALVRAFSPYKPMGADAERYAVEFCTAAGTVLRTKMVTTPAATYTTAEQAADAATAPVLVRVYQMNELVGRGYVATLSVP